MLYIVRVRGKGQGLVGYAVMLGSVAIVVIILAALVGCIYEAGGIPVAPTNPVNWF